MKLLDYLDNKTVSSSDKNWLKMKLKCVDVRALNHYIRSEDPNSAFLLAELALIGNNGALKALIQLFKNDNPRAGSCIYQLILEDNFKNTDILFRELSKMYFKAKTEEKRYACLDMINAGTIKNRVGSWYAMLDIALDDLNRDAIEDSLSIEALTGIDPQPSKEQLHTLELFDRSLAAYIYSKPPHLYPLGYNLMGCLAKLTMRNFHQASRAIKRFDERLSAYIKKVNSKRVDLTNDKPIVKTNIERLAELRFLIAFTVVSGGDYANTKERLKNGLYLEAAYAYADYITERHGGDFRSEQIGPMTIEVNPDEQPTIIEELYNQAMMPQMENEARSEQLRMLVLLSKSQPEAIALLEQTLKDAFNNIIHPTPFLDQKFLFQVIYEITVAITETGYSADLVDSEIRPGLTEIRELHPIHDIWCDSIEQLIHSSGM